MLFSNDNGAIVVDSFGRVICNHTFDDTLKVFKLNPEAYLPTRNNADDAGIDLYSLETFVIPIGSTKIVSTGVAIKIPVGFVGKVEDRSSMARNGLKVGGGIIDAGYSGEVSVVLHNLTNSNHSSFQGRGYLIEKGQKIAQLLLIPVETPNVQEVDHLWNSNRGSKGWGSSGK